MLEVISKKVSCPYCGEMFDALIDISAGNSRYTEDCYVCCRPIIFDCSLTSDTNNYSPSDTPTSTINEQDIVVNTLTEDEAF